METVFLILAIAFVVIMLILLPKYAKFIHQQPKAHMEELRRREEETKRTLEDKSE